MHVELDKAWIEPYFFLHYNLPHPRQNRFYNGIGSGMNILVFTTLHKSTQVLSKFDQYGLHYLEKLASSLLARSYSDDGIYNHFHGSRKFDAAATIFQFRL
jgi:hypothetical protein